MRDPLGGVLVVLVSVLAFAIVVRWARHDRAERMPVAIAASTTAALMLGIQVLAVAAGWWRGAFFTAPFLVQAAMDLPLGIAGYVLWLAGYRWLARHTRHPLRTYGGLVLIFIPIVVAADTINIARHQFTLGGGYTVWTDAIAGQIVLWSPVLFYEGLRQ